MRTIEPQLSGRVPELSELKRSPTNKKYYADKDARSKLTSKMGDVKTSEIASRGAPDL